MIILLLRNLKNSSEKVQCTGGLDSVFSLKYHWDIKGNTQAYEDYGTNFTFYDAHCIYQQRELGKLHSAKTSLLIFKIINCKPGTCILRLYLYLSELYINISQHFHRTLALGRIGCWLENEPYWPPLH